MLAFAVSEAISSQAKTLVGGLSGSGELIVKGQRYVKLPSGTAFSFTGAVRVQQGYSTRAGAAPESDAHLALSGDMTGLDVTLEERSIDATKGLSVRAYNSVTLTDSILKGVGGTAGGLAGHGYEADTGATYNSNANGNGTFTLAGASHIRPGTPADATQRLSFWADVTFSGDQSTIDLDIAGAAAGDFDTITVGKISSGTGGDVVGIENVTFNVNIPQSADLTGQTLTIMTAVSGLSGITPGQFVWTGDQKATSILANGTSIQLSNFTAVPEPGSVGLLAVGAVAAAARRRRR